MRDPLGLNERLFAAFYPRLISRAENAGQRDTRRRLLANATGATVEIGAGSGINLEHYTDRVTELILTEPSPHMLDHLRSAIGENPPAVGSYELVSASAQRLPFDDRRFDTAVCTYVLCSVPDPAAALSELARVLRPGGKLLFLEHVRAGEDTVLGRFQDLVEVPHRYIAAGCYPNRRTAELLADSPLQVQRLERGRQPAALPTVRPTITGVAVKRG
ncbi:MAG TPA: class I SAM-dependent methyltransferase [Solirubrobacteraceae bacterium]|jgi:ubiquinone/menaquinone biosynthesis C-methylase UbiE